MCPEECAQVLRPIVQLGRMLYYKNADISSEKHVRASCNACLVYVPCMEVDTGSAGRPGVTMVVSLTERGLPGTIKVTIRGPVPITIGHSTSKRPKRLAR